MTVSVPLLLCLSDLSAFASISDSGFLLIRPIRVTLYLVSNTGLQPKTLGLRSYFTLGSVEKKCGEQEMYRLLHVKKRVKKSQSMFQGASSSLVRLCWLVGLGDVENRTQSYAQLLKYSPTKPPTQ